MKHHLKAAIWVALATVILGSSIWGLRAGQASFELVAPPAAPGQMMLKMRVQSASHSVIYVIQTSSNLVNWETLASGEAKPGTLIQLANVATNRARFFRANEYSPDSVNPPEWTNGVGGQLTISPPAGATVSWNPATDVVGVSQYSIFVNGVLVTNVPGSTLTYQFTLNYQIPTDLRIQASDFASNSSPVLALLYIPGNEIAAVSDDSGRVYVFNYIQTNAIVTNGGFGAARQVVNFNANERGVALGDFDRDGIVDLVAGYPSGNTLYAFFFKGLGDGTFASGVPLPSAAAAVQGGYVMDMTVGDFDGDGDLDVVINGDSGSVVFYWGNGDGSFTPEVKNWADGNYSRGRGMAVGDFNEDGLDDIARAACCNGMIKVFLSNGDRTFVETNLIASGMADNDPYALAAGDFDEDGHTDLIVAGGGSGDVNYIKGFGNGSFVVLGTNGPWGDLKIGNYGGWDAYDFDGDGHLDLVMAGGTGQAYFWPGNGDGTFSSNRVTIATGLSTAFGASAPPKPVLVDVGISPRDPVTNINSTITYTAVGSGVSSNDFFRWSFGDTTTNPVAWTFGAGATNMGITVSHHYTNEGRYLTRLWHTTVRGTNSIRGTWATVKGKPPVANAGGPYVFGSQVATQGIWYATLDGSASTDDFGIISYVWNFGDGTGATNPVPQATHGWPSNGVYTVSLTVFDAARQSSSQSTTITFTNGAPPISSINGPAIVDETDAHNGTWTAIFYGTNSSSPVGIWKYAWLNVTTGQTANSSIFQAVWTAVGTNIISLMVTANDNQTNLATFTVVVKANGLPVPIIQGPQLLSVNVATNGLWFGAWNATNSTDDTGIYIYAWNFGDGSVASGTVVSHNYSAAGNYPLTLTVTDNGNQSVTATQMIFVVSGNPPIAKITASTLSPEASEPISFSGDNSTSDHGIYLYTWFLPPRQFDFFGQYIDPSQWVSTYATQNNKLTVSGQNNWGISYFFSIGTLLQRSCTLQGQVDTPSTANNLAMVGLKNLNVNSGHYGQYPYAIYFINGAIQIYEDGSFRGTMTNYLQGTAYDFQIVTKPGSGASYYLRPSGTGQPFALIYDSTYASYSGFSFGADIDSGVWSFENFHVDHVFLSGSDIKTSVNPGGTVTLQVVDAALLTNSTSVTVTPVVGSPPVAGISGPTNAQSGVQLAFNGYSSTDDYGIASYTWNFGDGSPAIFGPAVSHSYGTAGVYTNTLTVADYAEQTATASIVVTVTGSNVLVHVPWLIVNGIEESHPIFAGKTNTLKAVARNVSVPFSYVWTYGDGSGSVTNQVTNSAPVYNLEATHVYSGGDGTPYYAGISLVLSNGTVYQDTYPLLLQTKTLTVEEEVAIDEGLWHLQKTQARYSIDTNTQGGYWPSTGNISATASSVQAFAVNGHLMTDDPTRDPYVETVQLGVNYLLNELLTESIDSTPYGNPDANNNGIGLQANTSYPVYESGPVIDAFVAAARPELIALTGGANVKGRAYKDIVQDIADMFAWGQCQDPTLGGGWRYAWQNGPDNSASQWGAIGLFAASQFWGATVPNWVKTRNLVWVNYSEGQSGFGYTGPGDGIATTPSALVQLAFDGITTTNALWKHGESFLANNWNNFMSQNNVYANYSIAKAMRTAVPQPVQIFGLTGLDWFHDPVNGLARVTIDHQAPDASWLSAQWVDEPLASAWSILILSSSLFQQGPVAVISVKPNPSAIGYPVVFDGSGSYHKHPGYKIVDWRWIFSSTNGSDFNHPDATGPIVTNVYGFLSTNTALLQVRDNSTPQLFDTASVVIQTTVPPYPPTADAGGPYVACAGQDVHLDGSGSFCVDAAAGNFIQSYNWEVYYQVPVTFNQGVSGVQAVITNGYPIAGNYTIGLEVKNANSLVYTNFALPDETADAFTTVYVYDRLIPDLKVRPKATKAQLTWTKVGDYGVIMRSSLGPDRGYVQVGQTTSSYATFLDTTIEYNTDYYYRVYAYQNGQPIGVSDAVFLHSIPRSFDEQPPHFQSTPTRLAKVGQLYEVTLDATSPENEPMSFSLILGPGNMTVNPTTGVVDFTPVDAQVGNIPLSFQVTNSVGRDVLSYTLFVFPATNHPPVVAINGPYAALTGQDIQFSSDGTVDPDNNPLRYYWNFGDGVTSTDPDPVHAYGGIGNYLVSLFVNDGYGNTVSAKTQAQITRPNVPPVAVVSKGPNFKVRLGESLALDGSQSYSPLGNPLTYKWIFGDGAATNNAPSAVSHIYAAGGPYLGSLIVADNRGGSNTNNFKVTVGSANTPPIIVFTVSPTNRYVQSTVTFDATGTFDPLGDPISFSWDFGDHSKTTGSLVTHVFQQITNFTVTLTVADIVDTNNGTSTATQTIDVLDAPPVFTSSPQILTRAGTNYVYVPSVTSAGGSSCTFQLVQGPATMSCDTNSGTLTWLPGTNNLGPNPIDLRATDAYGTSADQAFTLVVSTPLGPQIDLQPYHIDMTNAVVDSETLAYSGTVRVYLRNNGSDTVPIPFTVSLFVDADFDGTYSTNTDYVVGYGLVPAGFPGNASAYVDMTVNGGALFVDCPLYAFVDSQNVVPEYNKLNNIMRAGSDDATNTPPVIDLSGSFLRVGRFGLPSNAVVTARLGNSGLVAVPTNVPMAFYDGNPQLGATLIGVASSTNILAPGQYEDLGVNWSSPTITPHTVFVVADDPGNGTFRFQEITYSNNAFSAVEDLSAVLPPVANAGQNQNVDLADTVTLNGSGSFDPQGRPLTYKWFGLTVPFGSHAQLSATNTVNPSFLADVAGLYSVRLTVNNGIVSSTNAATVSIAAIDTNVYYPPKITSTPSFQGMVTVPYAYQVTATDPQNKPLKFRLPQGPVGMTINTNSGLVQWTPTNAGSFFLQVAADGVGGSFYQGYTLTVIPFTNLPPVFISTPITTAAPITPYSYTAIAVSPVSNSVSYSLTQNPSGMSINGSSGVVTWTPAANQLGANPVTITANDGHGGSASQSFNLVVLTSGANGPVVQPIPSQTVTAPATFATFSLDNYVADPNYAPSQLTWTATGTNLLSVAIDSNRVATVSYPPGVNDAEQITFLATDPAGNAGFSTATFTIINNANPPIAAIANLAADSTTSITTGTFNLLGTADDPGVPVPVAYNIGLYDAGGALVKDLTPGPIDSAGYHEGRVPAGGSLGNLDFTMVRNGSYTLMLQVQANGQVASTTVQVAINSLLKIGQYKFSQQDLVLSAGGVGLQVSRTYNSLDALSADFGYGWTYAVADLGLTVNDQRADTQDLFNGTPFSLRVGGAWDVTLTMPDTGKTVTFTFSLFYGSFVAQAVWTPPPGVTATLVPTCSSELVTLPGSPPIWQAAGEDTDWQAFDWPGFVLTTKDGNQYTIDRVDLGEHNYISDSGFAGFVHAYTGGFLANVTMAAGQHADFIHNGADLQKIVQFDAANHQQTSILLQRDTQHRVNAIFLGSSLDSNGTPVGLPAMTYEYDSNSNLVRAVKLVDSTNPANLLYATNTYVYSNPQFPHYITSVINPLGVALLRSEYDANGRLVGTVDANGNQTSFQPNFSANTETIFDKLGNPSVLAYDNRGNVVATLDALGGVTLEQWDDNNRQTMRVDPLGHTNLFAYDANGNIQSRTDQLGNMTVLTHDAGNHLLSVTDPLGNTLAGGYDAGGNLVSATNATGGVTTFTYDAAGHKTAEADAVGNVTRFVYDSTGNMIQQIDPLGHVTSMGYDAVGNLTSQTDVITVAPGVLRTNVKTITYNQANWPVAVTDGGGGTTVNEYDLAGNLTDTIDSRGNRTSFIYDAMGQLLQTTFPDGTTKTTTYDAAGHFISETDRAGRTTQYQYDALGRLTAAIQPDQSQTGARYDAAGRIVASVDGRGNVTAFTLDANGRTIATTNALGQVSMSAYDAGGRLSSVTDPLGRSSFYQYDELGRVTERIFPDGSTTRHIYDVLGRCVTSLDQLGVSTAYGYDALGRLIAVTNAVGTTNQTVTTYTLNEVGAMLAFTDANGHVTTFEANPVDRQYAITLPMGQSSVTNCDVAGNVISLTNFNGQVTRFDYDANNRLAAKHLPEGNSVTYTYTPMGLQQTITDQRGTTRFNYDVEDQLIRRTEPNGRFVAYGYDYSGNRTSLYTPTRTNLFSYDALSRLESVTDAAGGVTHYSYDAANNVVTLQLPNGTVRTNGYDQLNRLVSSVHAGSEGPFATFQYARDAAGNRRNEIETFAFGGQTTSLSHSYDYDALYRVADEAAIGGSVGNTTNRYAYDAVGNRVQFSSSTEGATSYSYDANDRLLNEISPALDTAFTYDAAGRTLSTSNATENASYTWNSQDRLMAASTVDTNGTHRNLAYSYDDDGILMRTAAVAAGNTNTTDFLVDGNLPFAQVLEEWQSLDSQPASAAATYTYGQQLLSQTQSGVTSYFHGDTLGSTRVLTDPSGTPTDRYDYDAYGRTTLQEGSSRNPYLFAGERSDPALGLYYLRARYMDPRTGRFLSRDVFSGDTTDPVSLHRYLYAAANPLNRVDPGGLQSVAELDIATAEGESVEEAEDEGAVEAEEEVVLKKFGVFKMGEGAGGGVYTHYYVWQGLAVAGLGEGPGFRYEVGRPSGLAVIYGGPAVLTITPNQYYNSLQKTDGPVMLSLMEVVEWAGLVQFTWNVEQDLIETVTKSVNYSLWPSSLSILGLGPNAAAIAANMAARKAVKGAVAQDFENYVNCIIFADICMAEARLISK